MASYQKRKNNDGTTSVMAWVRIKPFKAASKAFSDKGAARVWAEALEKELKKQREHGEARKDLPSLTIKGLIDEFLADPETKQLKYYEDLKLLLAWWVNHCGAEKAMQFGTLKLREARDLLHNRRAPGTVNRYLSALRSCWNWGRAAGLVSQERAWPTRLMMTEPRGRVRFLSDDELKAVLVEAEKHSPWINAAIVVSIATGLRQGELLRLEWDHLDLDKGTLTVHLSKTGKRRLVHLNAPAVAALKKLRRDGIVGPKRVFVREDGTAADTFFVNYRWRAVRTAAGLSDFRWHDLRHTTASVLAQNGASLVEIGGVLGHSSPAVTARYSHLVAGKAVTGADKLAEKLSGNP